MRSIVLCLTFFFATGTFGQSKKELKFKIDSLESQKVQLELEQSRLSKGYKTLKHQYNSLQLQLNSANRELESKIKKELTLQNEIIKAVTQTISMSPYLCLTQGFPISFSPYNESLNLFLKPVTSEYQVKPDLVVNKQMTTSKAEEESMLILGIFDSSASCYGVSRQEAYGAAVILYDGKIWYTPISNLKDSEKLEEIISDYREAWLEERFGPYIAQRISNKRPWIGMTSSALEEMFGWPDNRQSIESIYGRTYTYTYNKSSNTYYVNYIIDIEDDIVTNIYTY